MGSILLPLCINDPFTENASINYHEIIRRSFAAQCFLDIVVDAHNLPVQANADELRMKRKRGLGFLGLADALIMLGIDYNSVEAIKTASDIQTSITLGSLLANMWLSLMYKPCPALETTDNIERYMRSPYWAERVYPKLKNFVPYNRFCNETIAKEVARWEKFALETGLRYTHATSVAPTATIAMISNYMSSGVEPLFFIRGSRNIIVGDSKYKREFSCYDYSFMLYVGLEYEKQGKEIANIDELCVLCEAWLQEEKPIPATFCIMTNVTIDAHLDVLAAVSTLLDQSASKTINVKSDTSFEDFKNVYMRAYELGIKGVTTYRPNPAKITSVIVDPNVQRNTKYNFTLANGDEYAVSGDTLILLPGETLPVTASNIYDSIVEANTHVVRKGGK